jgi:glutathione S-transferase
MSEVLLSGPLNGTHVTSARLACEEKGLTYQVQEPDLLKAGGFRLADLLSYLCERQPTLSHGDVTRAGLMLFDLEAILRYVDEAFPGPILQPENPRERALMTQVMAVIRVHLGPSAVGVVIAQRLFVPFLGGTPDFNLVARICPAMQDSLYAIEQLSLLSHDGAQSEFLIGRDLSLADIMLLPIAGYLMATPEGKAAIGASTRLSRWWLSLSRRASWARSKPKLG